jgi:phosphoribosylformylglycinamidine cyclo-ligase
MEKKAWTYQDAGVDIDAGNTAVELMKRHVQSTYRSEVIGDIGGFGGLFALNMKNYQEPVLVSGTDGVGTKLRLAFLMDKHDTIGIDAVAMCVNDILVQGAEPLFFLDYLAVGKLDPNQVAQIVKGVADGCRQAGSALIGGETAEMAGFYPEGEYDIAGFAVGIVDKRKIITGSAIAAGDVILGLPSSGLHSNGYSLVRKVCFDVMGMTPEQPIEELGKTLGAELLTPTRIYVQAIKPLLHAYTIKGMVHITGGGFTDNIPRVLPEHCDAVITKGTWAIPPIFKLLQQWGNIPETEMYRTFNMGIGMMIVVSAEEADAVISDLTTRGETVYRIGEIVEGTKVVQFK